MNEELKKVEMVFNFEDCLELYRSNKSLLQYVYTMRCIETNPTILNWLDQIEVMALDNLDVLSDVPLIEHYYELKNINKRVD